MQRARVLVGRANANTNTQDIQQPASKFDFGSQVRAANPRERFGRTCVTCCFAVCA